MTDEKLVSWKTWKAGISNNHVKTKTEVKHTNSQEDLKTLKNISEKSKSVVLFNHFDKESNDFSLKFNHTFNKLNNEANAVIVKPTTTFMNNSSKKKTPVSITKLYHKENPKDLSTSLCILKPSNRPDKSNEHSFTLLSNNHSIDDNDWKTKYRTQVLKRSNSTLITNTNNINLKNKLNQSLNLETFNANEENHELIRNESSIILKSENDYNKNCTNVQTFSSGILQFFMLAQLLNFIIYLALQILVISFNLKTILKLFYRRTNSA